LKHLFASLITVAGHGSAADADRHSTHERLGHFGPGRCENASGGRTRNFHLRPHLFVGTSLHVGQAQSFELVSPEVHFAERAQRHALGLEVDGAGVAADASGFRGAGHGGTSCLSLVIVNL